ncbi:UPF0592 membrane protein C7D4.03c [Ceratocystis fimbriata CBS 114723]|uniref:UPF0592 membrane protein C7D4.03c n=1 Tax=Ceratocystis fimbriata CBS 114723 TaxID=1035309 RepID=A0A2C5X595_9PEZI|nr:UPF0592 membrane protein C7D4.03c [Ceratocystis fimbriata CBS 114723]
MKNGPTTTVAHVAKETSSSFPTTTTASSLSPSSSPFNGSSPSQSQTSVTPSPAPVSLPSSSIDILNPPQYPPPSPLSLTTSARHIDTTSSTPSVPSTTPHIGTKNINTGSFLPASNLSSSPDFYSVLKSLDSFGSSDFESDFLCSSGFLPSSFATTPSSNSDLTSAVTTTTSTSTNTRRKPIFAATGFPDPPYIRPTTAPPTLSSPSFLSETSISSFAIDFNSEIPSFNHKPTANSISDVSIESQDTDTKPGNRNFIDSGLPTTTYPKDIQSDSTSTRDSDSKYSAPTDVASALSIYLADHRLPCSSTGPPLTPTSISMKGRQRSSTTDRSRSWLTSSKSVVSLREFVGDKSAKENATASGKFSSSSSSSKKLKKPEPGSTSNSSFTSSASSSTATATENTTPASSTPIKTSSEAVTATTSVAPVLDDNSSESTDRISRRKMMFGISLSRNQFSDSRSPSPRRNLTGEATTAHSQSAPDLPSLDTSPSSLKLRPPTRKGTGSSVTSQGSDVKPSKTFGRAGGYFSRMKRPGGVFRLGSSQLDNSDNVSNTSSAPSLGPPTSNVTAGSTTSKSASISEKSNATVTDDSSFEMLPSRLPDPLKASFRDLESEATKFETKTLPQRMQSVRTTVLPFLQRNGNNTSHKTICLEDMESRANTLNRWWTLLLDLLDGNRHQPIAGVDRLPLVEAVTLMMMRPEWRQTTSYFMPLLERCPGERVRARSWTNASNSTLSDNEAAYLMESAEHNIRAMFIANLARQLEIVTDKMSQRHASLGITNFCGKALAYGFFFVPGAADALVQLWGFKSSLIQRVADHFGLPRRSTGESEDIVALFPPYLGRLGWTSVRSVGAMLKKTPKMPPNISKIQWRGPWVNRWQGRDTDVFFIFVKYFHLLSQEFMPTNLPLVEKARSPGFVLVHSQLLAILDATINRHAVLEAYAAGPMPSSAAGADASGTDAFSAFMPYGAGPMDLMKGMSENRSLKLLKDFLSELSPSMAQAKRGFGEAYAALMKATASTTSQFNQAACITLCDFLEEALQIYDSHEEPGNLATEYIDWEFWMKAMQLMLQSHNTMIEIRGLCLVYAIWDIIARQSNRKKMFCMNWLLSEEVFDTFFNNWCPMVRAYYMRLLCWRICRDTGSANEVDAQIFVTVSERLKTTWAHYLHLKNESELNGTRLPNSSPSHPSPGKKFMIIRTEVHVVQNGMTMGFDSVGRIPNIEDTTLPEDVFNNLVPAAVDKPADTKKRWSLASIGKALLGGDSHSSEEYASTLSNPNNNSNKKALARPKSGGNDGPPPPPPKGHVSSPSDASSTGSSPMFDAQRYVFRFLLNWHPHACMAAPEMALARPRLPAPAQAWVSARRKSGSQPPVPAGLPPPTRMVSGISSGGLISEARNADADVVPETDSGRNSMSGRISGAESPARTSTPQTPTPQSPSSTDTPTPTQSQISLNRLSLTLSLGDSSLHSASSNGPLSPADKPTLPLKPGGIYAKRAVYSGRALAEWTLVVMECNNFVERRRDEGVLGLIDVEVPTLTLEPMRRPA